MSNRSVHVGGAVGRSARGMARYWPLAVLFVFLAVAVGYGTSLNTRAEVGRPAPDFTLPALGGGEVSLADFRGRPVIVNFWATWCPWCRYEAPAHQAFLERFGDKVAYLAVNLREPEDKVRRYRAAFAQRGIPLHRRELLDRHARVSRMYQFTGTPETWVIDGDGRSVRHFIGPTTFEQLVAAVEETGVDLWHPSVIGWVQAMAVGFSGGDGATTLWLGGDGGFGALHGGTGEMAIDRRLKGVRSVSLSPDGSRLWVVADERGGREGVLMSRGLDDGGVRWHRHLPGEEVLAVAAGPQGRVYAWTREQGLLRSDDAGASWRAVEAPYRPDAAGVAMAVDPHDPDHLLSAGPGGVWQTRDGGLAWRRTEIHRPVTGIAFDTGRPGRVYMTDAEGVLVSRDGGLRAERLDGTPQRRLVGIGVDVASGRLVAVSENGDIYDMGADGGGWRLSALPAEPAG